MAQTGQQGKKRKFVLSSCCSEKGYTILSKAPFIKRWLMFNLELRQFFGKGICTLELELELYTVYRNVDQPLPQDPVYKTTQCDKCSLQKSCEVHVTICTKLLLLSMNSLEVTIN